MIFFFSAVYCGLSYAGYLSGLDYYNIIHLVLTQSLHAFDRTFMVIPPLVLKASLNGKCMLLLKTYDKKKLNSLQSHSCFSSGDKTHLSSLAIPLFTSFHSHQVTFHLALKFVSLKEKFI